MCVCVEHTHTTPWIKARQGKIVLEERALKGFTLAFCVWLKAKDSCRVPCRQSHIPTFLPLENASSYIGCYLLLLLPGFQHSLSSSCTLSAVSIDKVSSMPAEIRLLSPTCIVVNHSRNGEKNVRFRMANKRFSEKSLVCVFGACERCNCICLHFFLFYSVLIIFLLDLFFSLTQTMCLIFSPFLPNTMKGSMEQVL